MGNCIPVVSASPCPAASPAPLPPLSHPAGCSERVVFSEFQREASRGEPASSFSPRLLSFSLPALPQHLPAPPVPLPISPSPGGCRVLSLGAGKCSLTDSTIGFAPTSEAVRKFGFSCTLWPNPQPRGISTGQTPAPRVSLPDKCRRRMRQPSPHTLGWQLQSRTNPPRPSEGTFQVPSHSRGGT